MSARATTLPLGVDVGRNRVRIALSTCAADGSRTLVAVAAREHAGEPGPALKAALAELKTRERRCVFALINPEAQLFALALPPMPPRERLRAARFEATRIAGYPIGDSLLTLIPNPAGTGWVGGLAHRQAVRARDAVMHAARLRTVAVDDAAIALRRALPDADAAIDIGAAQTQVCFFTNVLPRVTTLPIGGDHFTTAIARSLGIDTGTAEERKRALGFAGAGEAERDTLIAGIADTFAGTPYTRVAVCGNGARVPGLIDAIARATGIEVVPAMLPAASSASIPADVLRVAGPDWSLAYGLSIWTAAR